MAEVVEDTSRITMAASNSSSSMVESTSPDQWVDMVIMDNHPCSINTCRIKILMVECQEVHLSNQLMEHTHNQACRLLSWEQVVLECQLAEADSQDNITLK